MTIEIRQPELEALILERLGSGTFQNVEDVLMEAMKATAPGQRVGSRRRLKDVFAAGRGLAEDLDITRDPSPGRDIDL